jgi:hypothetical protein
VWTHCHGNMFVSRSLPSNWSMRYIASYQHTTISSFLRAVLVELCDQSHLPSPQLSSCRDYSWAAPAAASLRPLIPSSSLIRCQWVQVYYHHPSSSQCRHKFREWSVLLYPWLLNCC